MGKSHPSGAGKPRRPRKPRRPDAAVAAERRRFWNRIHRQLDAVEPPRKRRAA